MSADHLLDDFFDHGWRELFKSFFDDGADAVQELGVIARSSGCKGFKFFLKVMGLNDLFYGASHFFNKVGLDGVKRSGPSKHGEGAPEFRIHDSLF